MIYKNWHGNVSEIPSSFGWAEPCTRPSAAAVQRWIFDLKSQKGFSRQLPEEIWDSKYRYVGSDGGKASIRDTWNRVAAALAAVETRDPARWQARFMEALEEFTFLPAGRILADTVSSGIEPVFAFDGQRCVAARRQCSRRQEIRTK